MPASDDNFGRNLLLSLPPMEARDWNTTKAHLKELGLYSDDAMKERDVRTCVEEEGSGGSDALRAAVKQHQEELYQKKDAVTARSTVVVHDGKTVIRTYAEHLAPHNCSNGCWSGEWILDGLNLSGKVSLHVHYYEDMNVQMQSTRDFSSSTVAGDDEESLAKAVAEHIAKCEKEVYDSISDLFQEGGEMESKMKQVRRILPITRTRFKWDTAAQQSVKLLNERKTN